jgi:hypothetical protein
MCLPDEELRRVRERWAGVDVRVLAWAQEDTVTNLFTHAIDKVTGAE